MKPIIIYNSFITKYFELDGLVLYPFILISEKKENTPLSTLKHEFIHIEQIKRIGIFQFYYQYLHYILKSFNETDDLSRAFIENKFEEEAYNRENETFTKEEMLFIK
jgi:hypothetical protein